MLIISSVCADFRDRNGNTVHRIKAGDLNLFREAPEAIKEDPLFALLVADGSIRFPEDAFSRRKLENDPAAGMTASGKSLDKALKPEKAEKKPAPAGKPEEPAPETKPKEEKK